MRGGVAEGTGSPGYSGVARGRLGRIINWIFFFFSLFGKRSSGRGEGRTSANTHAIFLPFLSESRQQLRLCLGHHAAEAAAAAVAVDGEGRMRSCWGGAAVRVPCGAELVPGVIVCERARNFPESEESP